MIVLRYDAETDHLGAKVVPAPGGETVRVQQGRLALDIDPEQKLIASFEVSDFRHFVNYHLLDELFGDQVVRQIAAFQSAIPRRTQQIQASAPPRSSRRVVDELLRAA
jgi:hypothetical protein